MWFFDRKPRQRVRPVSPVKCRRRLPELPSIVCQQPRGHVGFCHDDRDPSFGFKWAARGVVVEKWPQPHTWWEGAA